MEKVMLVSEVRQWLINNEIEYKKITLSRFAPLNNETYFLFNSFIRLLEYLAHDNDCIQALDQLRSLSHKGIDLCKNELILWIKRYENLAHEKLLIFLIDYFDFTDLDENSNLRIQNNIFVEREPFVNIINFCNAFNLLETESLKSIDLNHDLKEYYEMRHFPLEDKKNLDEYLQIKIT